MREKREYRQKVGEKLAKSRLKVKEQGKIKIAEKEEKINGITKQLRKPNTKITQTKTTKVKIMTLVFAAAFSLASLMLTRPVKASETVTIVGNLKKNTMSVTYDKDERTLAILVNFPQNYPPEAEIMAELYVSNSTSSAYFLIATGEVNEVGTITIDVTIDNFEMIKSMFEYKYFILYHTCRGDELCDNGSSFSKTFSYAELSERVDNYEITKAIINDETYSVVFDTNGGSGVMEALSYCVSGYTESCILPQNTFTRVGYTFSGWSEDSAAISPTYSDGQAVDLPRAAGETVTLYAIWEANKYSIVFVDADDGEKIAEEAVRYDEDFIIPDCEYEKEGFIFDGWNTEKDGFGTAYAPGDIVSGLTESGEFNLYAQWKVAEPNEAGNEDSEDNENSGKNENDDTDDEDSGDGSENYEGDDIGDNANGVVDKAGADADGETNEDGINAGGDDGDGSAALDNSADSDADSGTDSSNIDSNADTLSQNPASPSTGATPQSVELTAADLIVAGSISFIIGLGVFGKKLSKFTSSRKNHTNSKNSR